MTIGTISPLVSASAALTAASIRCCSSGVKKFSAEFHSIGLNQFESEISGLRFENRSAGALPTTGSAAAASASTAAGEAAATESTAATKAAADEGAAIVSAAAAIASATEEETQQYRPEEEKEEDHADRAFFSSWSLWSLCPDIRRVPLRP